MNISVAEPQWTLDVQAACLGDMQAFGVLVVGLLRINRQVWLTLAPDLKARGERTYRRQLF